MKNNSGLINNNLLKSPYNYPFSLKGMNKSNYLYMQLKNNSNNNNQKPNLNLNSYLINNNKINSKQKSKSKQKSQFDKNMRIKNIKTTIRKISQSQNNKYLNLDNSFNINNNRNNSEKIKNNKNIREASFLGYSKNSNPIKQKNNINIIKGFNINNSQKSIKDISQNNNNKSERNKTPILKQKENMNNIFKITPSDYSMILSNSSLNGNNLSQGNINPKISSKIKKYGINNYNNSNSIKKRAKIRTNSDFNLIQNRPNINHNAFQPKNIFYKFKRKKTSNNPHGFGYNNILVNNNNNYLIFGSLLEENKNSSHSVNTIYKAKEEKEKININKSQTQNSIKTNDTSGLQINVNSNLLSIGNISNYNINNHYNQSLNVDCHEINLSLLGKSKNEESKIIDKKETKVEKKWKGKNIKCIHDLSKTGLAGDEKKVNQDNYFIFKNFVQGFENIYMGVCDGHGYYGHEVSGYIKENLPMDLNHALKQKNLDLLKDDLSPTIKECFIQENQNLLNNHQIDSDLSGTTCISVIYTPKKLIIANIGDSRCVLGKYDKKENKFISENLSRDHKPTIPEEAERILKVGGRIRPMLDEDGEFIGPLRVYMKEKEMPGLAMTRSFGDYFGSTAGTISEPEVTEHVFKEEDKFIVIASDGLYEFIESEEVVKLVGEFYKKNDIVGCCEFLYKESYRRWIDEEEDTVDDITIIVVFFEDKYE